MANLISQSRVKETVLTQNECEFARLSKNVKHLLVCVSNLALLFFTFLGDNQPTCDNSPAGAELTRFVDRGHVRYGLLLRVYPCENALVRNRFLREDLAEGRFGLGQLLFNGRIALQSRQDNVQLWLRPLRGLKRKIRMARGVLMSRMRR